MPKRVAVLGCSGAGKSTVAKALSLKLGLPFVPTDPIFWTDGWKPVPATDVRSWLAAVTSADCWVLDGNFVGDREIYWARAELAVWLDPPFLTTLWHVLRRNFGWWLSGIAIWHGERMTLAKALGGAGHVIQSHGLKRRTYPGLLVEFLHLQIVRIRSRRALKKWLDGQSCYAG